MTTTNPQERRDQNIYVLSGQRLAKTGWRKITRSPDAAQKFLGTAMLLGAGALVARAKIVSPIWSGIQRSSVAIAEKAEEKGIIEKEDVGPVAVGLAIATAIVVVPKVLGLVAFAAAADGVLIAEHIIKS